LTSSRLLASVLVAWLVAAAPASSQSIVSGTLGGTVVDASDRPISGAVVLLRATDVGLAREATVDRLGRFSFSYVLPGTYEARVEALGYQPVLLRPVRVTAGEATPSLQITLEEAQPPVVSLDTVDLSSRIPSRWLAGGSRSEARDIDVLPDRTQRLGSVALLSSLVDDALGATGLPGETSVLFIDGIPFHSAGHPAIRGEELGAQVLPRLAISDLVVLADGPDVEYTGASGAYLAATTRTGTAGGGPVEVGGAWSGDPLWSSSRIDGDPPGLTSLWGDARISVDLAPDTTTLFLGGQFQQRQEPVAARAPGGAPAGLDPALAGGLGAPALQEVTQVGGVGRLDWWLSPTQRFLLRALVARQERTFAGPPPPASPAYGSALPTEALDFSLGTGIVSELGRRITLEVRGGLSASTRTFGLEEPEAPPTHLVEPGLELGQGAATPAEVSRLDVFLSPLAYWRLGPGTLKFGGQFFLANGSMTHGPASSGRWLGGDAGRLLGGTGSVFGTTGPESSFTTLEVGGLAQYGWNPAPNLRFTLGGRVDWERIPDETDLNLAWLEASGLASDEHPRTFVQLAGRTSLTWDVASDGGTVLDVVASVHSGNMGPALLHQVYAGDGEVQVQRSLGDGLSWPDGSGLGGAPRLPALTLLGPDAQPPRSSRFAAGLVQRLSDAFSLHLRGSFRRTDFLTRRRNLNLPLLPATTDVDGRPVFGELVKQGALVVTEPASNRRFPDFDDVWAMDPDGWSESVGFTVGLEHRGPVDFFASYTRSSTEDNWVGAAAGTPEAAVRPRLGETLETWDEGTSDFDVPDRLVAGLSVDLGVGTGATLSALYRYSSGLPFTPGYRYGVDVNGDGSGANDPAFIPRSDALPDRDCLDDHLGAFVARNACRGPARQSLDARITVGLGTLGGQPVELRLDGFNLVESEAGLVDHALFLVDPDAPLATGPDGTLTVPTLVNPDFGEVVLPSSPGRILRIGFRIGA
jgi:hypothetical protein